MLKIAVCVKQVPKNQIGIDENTGNIIREDGLNCMNIYDYAAVETALRIKEQTEAEVDIFTMGRMDSRGVLQEALALGADEGILISDSKYAGSDVLATSYILSRGIMKKGDYHLIICGKQTTDGDTAQVSGAIASQLNWNYLPWIHEIAEVTEKEITACMLMDFEKIEVTAIYPCVISVEPSIYTVRIPTLMNTLKSRKKNITVYGQSELSLPEHAIGQKGAPTRVAGIKNLTCKAVPAIRDLTAAEIVRLICEEAECPLESRGGYE
ncbi:MAG: electron transfer flavoprotein subunit beta/FixA family protein [Hespellia sp.]|nr:electron transfer flavoprotein subunit beta/FixA family protein [Hespellia sp.]